MKFNARLNISCGRNFQLYGNLLVYGNIGKDPKDNKDLLCLAEYDLVDKCHGVPDEEVSFFAILLPVYLICKVSHLLFLF